MEAPEGTTDFHMCLILTIQFLYYCTQCFFLYLILSISDFHNHPENLKDFWDFCGKYLKIFPIFCQIFLVTQVFQAMGSSH